ncbi:acetyltransferase domain protein [Leptolyngbya sp. Heron Island J]|uniref:GNAT family N-acetyltransferase n=1 Tax=Leptolyngbya sp. Heron Island J TaxID=1385935 RepID=UPI0003B97EF6|nr:GNAT family N-acetyltransferase [Leptolyngbya sp. Heron Island J]ESA32251.1 acetyltransferase domain protein [Leptolyngbya sp. Heron Island J]
MNYFIRLAQSSDVEYLPAIEKAAAQRYLAYLPQLGLTPNQLQDIVSVDFLYQALRQHHLWVAVWPTVPPTIVGFIVVDRLPDGYFIIELDVLPTYGRRGIGSALIRQVLQSAWVQGLTTVTLTTFRHVPWTMPFYQRLGFEIVVPEDYTPNIRTIVDHEERHGFSRQVRAVMQCQILRLGPSLPPCSQS